jgi:hypothetical protein
MEWRDMAGSIDLVLLIKHYSLMTTGCLSGFMVMPIKHPGVESEVLHGTQVIH